MVRLIGAVTMVADTMVAMEVAAMADVAMDGSVGRRNWMNNITNDRERGSDY